MSGLESLASFGAHLLSVLTLQPINCQDSECQVESAGAAGMQNEQIVGVGAVLEPSTSGPLQVTKLVPGGPAQVFMLQFFPPSSAPSIDYP